MLNKIFGLFIFFGLVAAVPVAAVVDYQVQGQPINITSQSEDRVDVYFFNQIGCPHCATEKEFFEDLLSQEPYSQAVKLHSYEISRNPGNFQILKNMAEEKGFEVRGVPVTIIGDEVITGYSSDSIQGEQIKNLIDKKLGLDQPEDDNEAGQAEGYVVHLPFFGETDLKQFSLPAIAVILGALDGFNPCAMWALLFLISLLLGLNDKRKMWLLGSIFILISGLVYFVFMVAWLKAIMFIGFTVYVRLFIGAIAVGGGIYNLNKFKTNKDGGCDVGDKEKRKEKFQRMKELVYGKNFWLAVLGIAVLAFSVNLVELVCSAGLPAVFTALLAASDLSALSYYGYILLYILFFLIDDLLIFFVAMTTLRLTGMSTKYSRWSSLIGGILMILIGLVLVLKPEWLMFS